MDKRQDIYHIEDITPRKSAGTGVTEEMRVSEAYVAHEPIIDPPVNRLAFSHAWTGQAMLMLHVDEQGSDAISGSHGVFVDWLSDSGVFVRRSSSIQSVFFYILRSSTLTTCSLRVSGHLQPEAFPVIVSSATRGH